MPETILVVDDETEITDLVALYLENEGYCVQKAFSAAQALEQIAAAPPDLAILDVMLPDQNGFDLCRKIRSEHSFPILMLTARVEATDKITGLTLGADDYVTKPFLPLELVARCKAHLRRYRRYPSGAISSQPPDELTCSGLTLHLSRHTCQLHGNPLALTPTEFEILRILMQAGGAVVSSESLFRQLWPNEYYTKNNNTITVHIRHLREKMGDTFENPKYIQTVWGCGYKIEI